MGKCEGGRVGRGVGVGKCEDNATTRKTEIYLSIACALKKPGLQWAKLKEKKE